MPSPFETAPTTPAIPITFVTKSSWEQVRATLPPPAAAFAMASGFAAKPDACLVLPTANGEIGAVLFGLEDDDARARDPFRPGALPNVLPPGVYRFANAPYDARLAALAFALGSYRFARYRKADRPDVKLQLANDQDGGELSRIADAATLARDLINTPANDMGPEELEQAARDLAARYGANVSSIVGDDNNNTLDGTAGDDTISGGGGGDLITDGQGSDEIYGGDGADTIVALHGADTSGAEVRLFGGGGDDIIHFQGNADGGDTVRLDAGAVIASAVEVDGFVAGDGGDQFDFAAFLTTALSNWDGVTDPFSDGHVQLAVSGGDTILQIDADGGGDSWQTVAVFHGADAAGFTAFNLSGFSPVIGHSGRFLSAGQRVGPEFDKTWFIVASASQGAGKNVAAVDYNNIHIGYLMGVLAAKMTKSGKIGVVAGCVIGRHEANKADAARAQQQQQPHGSPDRRDDGRI